MSDRVVGEKWLENVQLICKPEQSGKTFIMIQQLIQDLSDPIPEKQIINIICCDNNLLLTSQTSLRVDKELKPHVVGGIVYIELSSHKRTKYHDTDSVIGAIIKGVRNVICCTNGTRMDDITTLIHDLNNNPFTAEQFHFNIWFDEADKFIPFIDNTLVPIIQTYENVNIKLITATPSTLFNKYKFMNVFPIEHTTSPDYHGWTDNIICTIDIKKSCVDFVHHILTNVAHHNIKPGTKWFIPGEIYKTSHNDITQICLENEMAVLCVNGDGMKLTLPVTYQCFIIEKDEKDFNTKLCELYILHNLHEHALAITGNKCIGRGISFISPEFILDYSILSSCSNKNEASQTAGRTKANSKKFPKYKPTIIYTTPEFNKVATEWESKSRKLAELAFDKDQKGELCIISSKEFKNCDSMFEYQRGHSVFHTQLDNETYAKKYGLKQTRKYKSNAEGFKMCTTTRNGVHSLDEIMKFTTTDNEGSNMDKKLSDLKVGEYTYRCYVCYEDLTNNSTERYVTIWVKRIK